MINEKLDQSYQMQLISRAGPGQQQNPLHRGMTVYRSVLPVECFARFRCWLNQNIFQNFGDKYQIRPILFSIFLYQGLST